MIRENVPNSSLATVALVLGILGLGCPLLGALALVLGFVALGEIDRSDGRLQGQGRARTGAILGGVGTLLLVVAILAGVVLPALQPRRNPRGGRQMQNSTQVRGIIQGCILYAQSNNEYYPGLTSTGGSNIPSVSGPTLYTVAPNDQSASNRLAILLNGNYFTPEYARSPNENTPKNAPALGSPLTTGNFSYAMLQISGTPRDAGRDKEWKATTNTQAAVMGDRGLGGNLKTTTIHVSTTTDPATTPNDWRGSVGWNDNHVEFMTSALMPNTKYDQTLNTDDNLFVEENNLPNVTPGANALFIYD